MIRRITILVSVIIISLQGAFAQKYEMYKGDTINYEDAAGLKRGHWMVYNRDLKKKLADFSEDQLVEEGKYINNRKEGIWKQYYNNGKKKNEITYVNGRPNGFSRFYYKSGTVSEEGNWVNGKWDGNYKFYYENGQLEYDWTYVGGKREGVQKYYWDNGKTQFEGSWKDGQEDGILKEYNKEGQLIATKVFKPGGKIDTVASVYITPTPVVSGPKSSGKDKTSTNTNTNNNTSDPVVTPKAQVDNYAVESVIEEDTERAWLNYKESGFHRVVTKAGHLIREGTFDKGIFITGKAYKYSGGKRIKTIIYKNGKAIEVLEER